MGWGSAPLSPCCSDVNCIYISSYLFVITEKTLPSGYLSFRAALFFRMPVARSLRGEWFTPQVVCSPCCHSSLPLKAGEPCPTFAGREQQGAIGCLPLVSRKEGKSVFTLRYSGTSVCCLLPTSFDLSLTFHKTSLSCPKDTVIALDLQWFFPKTKCIKATHRIGFQSSSAAEVSLTWKLCLPVASARERVVSHHNFLTVATPLPTHWMRGLVCERNTHQSRWCLLFQGAFPDRLPPGCPYSFLFRSVCLSYQAGERSPGKLVSQLWSAPC